MNYFILSFLISLFCSSSLIADDTVGVSLQGYRHPQNCGLEFRRGRVPLAQTEQSCNQTFPKLSNGTPNPLWNGDPNFNESQYRNIPVGSQVTITTTCLEDPNPLKSRFYTVVKYKKPGESRSRVFTNPYFRSATNRDIRQNGKLLGIGWLTSPGIYSRPDGTQEPRPGWNHPGFRTHARATNPISSIAELQGVSENAAWDGVLPFAVGFGQGFFYHASSNVTGNGESKGCPRLEMENARALYNLVRKVGPANVTVKWDIDSRTGGVDYKSCTQLPSSTQPSQQQEQAPQQQVTR